MPPTIIRHIVVLGGGTAGLLTALSLRTAFPTLRTYVVHSPNIPTIGVGEGTTPLFPRHLLQSLRLDPNRLHEIANPTWKLGIRFLWGPRPVFYYSFTQQFDARWSDLPRPNGFYCDPDYLPADLASALMSAGKCAPRRLDGSPDLLAASAFHVENARLVKWLDAECRRMGIEFIEAAVQEVNIAGNAIESVHLDTGGTLRADFFVDASGFRAELLARALREPWEDWSHVLACDRAVIGGWPREDEPILPFTTAETLDAGWAWQIEHEHFINRGYVYSSNFLDENSARLEFLQANPKIAADATRVVRFRSGRLRRSWVGNAVALGNSAGFVEPLEATALSVLVLSVRALVAALTDSALAPTSSHASAFNRYTALAWEETRDFLALHYRFNTRRDTPFWRHARETTDLGALTPLVEFYQEAGPDQFARHLLPNADNIYGLEGHLALLVGQSVPHRNAYTPSPAEYQKWRQHCEDFAAAARIGLTVTECLQAIRAPKKATSMFSYIR